MKSLSSLPARNVTRALTHGWGRLASALTVLIAIGVIAAAPLQEAASDIELFFRVQNELNKTPQGRRYIYLFSAFRGEILRRMQADPVLWDEGLALFRLWRPNLQAWVDGRGGDGIIAHVQVQAAVSFLDHLSAAGSSELQQAISSERARSPLESLAGLSMDRAYALLMEQSYAVSMDPIFTPTKGRRLVCLPPLSADVPYEAQAGVTIPVEFAIEDGQGQHVIDRSTTLIIIDLKGNLAVGPIGIGKDLLKGITVQGDKYHYDFRTAGLADGRYIVQASFDMADASQRGCVIDLSEGE